MKDLQSLCAQVRKTACLKSARLEHALLINFGSYKFEMRKFVWSQDVARRKSKPTFLLAAVFAFFAFFAV
jgi:hypothetical protein